MDYGSFVVLESQKELMNQTANFDILHKIAFKTNGRFYQPMSMDSLVRDLTVSKLGKTQILDQHKYSELIHFKFLFWVIFLILSLEWFVRTVLLFLISFPLLIASYIINKYFYLRGAKVYYFLCKFRLKLKKIAKSIPPSPFTDKPFQTQNQKYDPK